MSNVINLTVSLNKEDRDRIDAIIDLLQGKFEPQPQETEPVKEMNLEPTKDADSASEAPEPAPLPDIGDGSEVPEPHIEAAAAEPAPAPTCTREDLQRKVVELCAAGKKPEVKEIVNAYAERVGAIPEDKLDECMSKLITLEG